MTEAMLDEIRVVEVSGVKELPRRWREFRGMSVEMAAGLFEERHGWRPGVVYLLGERMCFDVERPAEEEKGDG